MAMAFIVFRIGQDAIKTMRNAGFDIDIGPQYFDFFAEFQIFLVQVADRIAFEHFTDEERVAFTTALANRVAEIQADNQAELLGGVAADHKRNFIELLNRRSEDYAGYDYATEGGKYAFFRHLGNCMETVVEQKDRHWVTGQVTEVQAPDAARMVEKSMRGLLDTEPEKRVSSRTAGTE